MQEYLIPGLLTSIIIRVLISGDPIGETIGIISLSSLYGVFLYLNNNKEIPINDSFKNEINQLKQDIRLTKDTVSSLKLASNLKK